MMLLAHLHVASLVGGLRPLRSITEQAHRLDNSKTRQQPHHETPKTNTVP
jgi:hypothetical protein